MITQSAEKKKKSKNLTPVKKNHIELLRKMGDLNLDKFAAEANRPSDVPTSTISPSDASTKWRTKTPFQHPKPKNLTPVKKNHIELLKKMGDSNLEKFAAEANRPSDVPTSTISSSDASTKWRTKTPFQHPKPKNLTPVKKNHTELLRKMGDLNLDKFAAEANRPSDVPTSTISSSDASTKWRTKTPFQQPKPKNLTPVKKNHTELLRKMGDLNLDKFAAEANRPSDVPTSTISSSDASTKWRTKTPFQQPKPKNLTPVKKNHTELLRKMGDLNLDKFAAEANRPSDVPTSTISSSDASTKWRTKTPFQQPKPKNLTPVKKNHIELLRKMGDLNLDKFAAEANRPSDVPTSTISSSDASTKWRTKTPFQHPKPKNLTPVKKNHTELLRKMGDLNLDKFAAEANRPSDVPTSTISSSDASTKWRTKTPFQQPKPKNLTPVKKNHIELLKKMGDSNLEKFAAEANRPSDVPTSTISPSDASTKWRTKTPFQHPKPKNLTPVKKNHIELLRKMGDLNLDKFAAEANRPSDVPTSTISPSDASTKWIEFSPVFKRNPKCRCPCYCKKDKSPEMNKKKGIFQGLGLSYEDRIMPLSNTQDSEADHQKILGLERMIMVELSELKSAIDKIQSFN